jgi:curli biogenesis system outer membrane secretion channel CsgG
MKRIFSLVISLSVVLIGSLALAETEIKEQTFTLPKCSAPIAKVALGKIACKASQCRKTDVNGGPGSLLQQLASLSGQPSFEGIGDGIGDMLISILKQTNCFEVMERENLEEVQQELALIGKRVQIEAADLLIGGSITSIRVEKTNTNLGFGIIPVLSAVDIKKTKATMNMDLRLIDVGSAKIVATKTYEAQSGKSSLGIGAGAAWGNVGFGDVYSNLKGSALEEVAREIVLRGAVDLIESARAAVASKTTSQPAPVEGHTIPEPAPVNQPQIVDDSSKDVNVIQ